MFSYGVYISGISLSNWTTHSIDTTNKVHNKPVIYWKNKNHLKILKVDPFPYALYVPGTKVRVALTSPFNGILMVDTSGSMYNQMIPNLPGTLRLSDDPILAGLTNTG